MKFGVVVFPGTWSDCDFHYVISEVLHQPVRYVWHRNRTLEDLDCVILPGGFSYGDYLRAGADAERAPAVSVRFLPSRGRQRRHGVRSRLRRTRARQADLAR